MGTRVGIVVVALACNSFLAYADEPAPPLAEAIKSAADSHKPLLLEFGAEWCGPCKQFAEKTLPDPRVQAALKDVVFVRYDAEARPGIEAARKYKVYSYPTFVVVDKQGVERYRQSGAPFGEPGVKAAIDLVAKARVVVMDEADIRASVKKAPNDAKVRLTAASWFLDREMRSDAMAQYDAVSANKSATSAQRIEATRALVHMRRLDHWKQQLLNEKIALIEASPADAVPDDLTVVMLGSSMPAADKRKLLTKVLEAQADMSRLNNLVYVALAAGATEDALNAAKRVVASSRTGMYLDTLAECYFISGDRKKALELEDEALKLVKGTSAERQLRMNRGRFDRGSGHSTEVRQKPARVRQFWKQMEHVDELPDHVHDPDAYDSYSRAWSERWNQFQKATQDLEGAISKACAKEAGSVKQAMARLELIGDGRISSSVLLLEPNTSTTLSDCITNQLAAAQLPKYKPWDQTMLTFNFSK